ncbi:MAG: 16S rRNA (cytosine(967)-C(5))-methyltransferase RsmB [Alphaproteobacteria bacterium]|nr:16S rRNA (cytosine(967)-C(5))-methyltransferase RsmB [Alphaproteobacteria bacterium]
MDNAVKSRYVAFNILKDILFGQKTLDGIFDRQLFYQSLSHTDKQFVRMLVLTVLRRWGQLKFLVNQCLDKPLPEKRRDILVVLALGVAQLYYLNTPPHAATDTAVQLTRVIKQSAFTKLVNAVLRSFVRKGKTLKEPSVLLNYPEWLMDDWKQNYGEEVAEKMLLSLMDSGYLDITVKTNPQEWAERWNGVVLNTGTVRCPYQGDVALMDGYADGLWWVQEASASIPAQLFDELQNKRVADLCAAPGGKTAQLACRRAFVDAYDISEKRLMRLRENMKRLKLEDYVQVKCQDILTITEKQVYDAVLLDAPCSATGTIRRHPDLLYHRTKEDVQRLTQIQSALLQKAIDLLKPNGQLVYSTCSLMRDENESVVQQALLNNKNLERVVLNKKWQPFLNANGAIQVLPTMGQDGFYAVLLRKKST